MDDLLSALRNFDALRDEQADEQGDQVRTGFIPAVGPTYVDRQYLDKIPSELRLALTRLGITSLYRHQAEAIDRILAGDDVIIESPTASGKTLCFAIPIIMTLMDDPSAHALMVHPMKAVSNDQRRQFEELASGIRSGQRKIESWVYDGDLEKDHRSILRENPPAVLYTNPEMLHQSFLGHRHLWMSSEFIKNLRFIVLDEIHEYRGFFGTNVALLLRRFLAYLAKNGVRPQIILATATCSNPEEHANRLTGRTCRLVSAKDAPRPERQIVFINPRIPDFRFHDIYRLRIARAVLACLAGGMSVLVFCPSRRFAEDAAILARREVEKFAKEGRIEVDPSVIAPYRSGYQAELRRSIEDGLRSGRIRAAFSTNALEIGVDIGRLDVCILAGFPDSVFSAWQRIGRVGRSWQSRAYVLFYAFNNPFDRFYAENIDAFLQKPLDEILIGVDNEELMAKHLPYLVWELGGDLGDSVRSELGDTLWEFARAKIGDSTPARIKPNYQTLNIRGNSGKMVRLIYRS